MKRMPLALAIVAATLLVLSACSATTVAQSSEAGYPATVKVPDPFSGKPVAAWGSDKSTFLVVAFGPSNCEPIPTELKVLNADEMSLEIEVPHGSCNDDVSATTFTFATPESIQANTAITITVKQSGESYRLPISGG